MYEYNTFIPVSYAIFNFLLFSEVILRFFLLILEDKGNLYNFLHIIFAFIFLLISDDLCDYFKI